jgi:tRNA pseudouridine55 synthase
MNESGGAAGSGFLLLDKPPGVSSFRALAPVKRLFRGAKVGHAGTLDPAASGLLLVGIGHGTRLLEYLEGMPKAYAFTVRFGLVSDSYDMEGPVSGEPARGLSRAAVEAALPAFRGRIRQAPPAYSAVKVEGRRAYDLARAGEAVALAPREVEIHSLVVLDLDPDGGTASLRMECS